MFLVNKVPIGVLALVLATRWVPSREAAKTDAMPDLFGAGVLALSIGASAPSSASARWSPCSVACGGRARQSA